MADTLEYIDVRKPNLKVALGVDWKTLALISTRDQVCSAGRSSL